MSDTPTVADAITADDIKLIREQGDVLIRSYEVRNVPARHQPTEWHEGQRLRAIADMLAAGASPTADSAQAAEDDTRHETQEANAGDAVTCSQCGWRGIVAYGTEICPNCKNPDGTLMWTCEIQEDAR